MQNKKKLESTKIARIERWKSFYLEQFSSHGCLAYVSEEQIKIYDNIKKGNLSMAKIIQKFLVKSPEACHFAVWRVMTNKGGKTSGIDGFVPSKRFHYLELIQQLLTCTPDNYKASPLARIWIPKAPPSTDKRPLSLPTIFDLCLQALWALALDPVNEAYSDPYNYGFRKGRAPKDAMSYVRNIITKNNQPEYIVELDIRKCFDSISHNYILETVMVNKKILRQWLKAGVMDSEQFYYHQAGVLQGGIISPIICNLSLNGFQNQIKLQLQQEVKNPFFT